MSTILYFENEELSCLSNSLLLKQIRQLYREETLVMISAGEFTDEGELLRPSCKDRAEEYIQNGADLVLSLPTASILGGYGKKEFAGAALVQRLRTADLLVMPCAPLAGQTVNDCEKALRACAMEMFLAGPDYRRELTGNLASGLPFRGAQRKALCTCLPESEELLSSPVNRQALWLLDAMLQLYYMAVVQFIPVPELEDHDRCAPAHSDRDNCATASKPCEEQKQACKGQGDPVEVTDHFEQTAALRLFSLFDTVSEEQLIDIAGSTSQLVTDLFEKKERIRTAGSLKEIATLLLPTSPDRSRLFLLKAILGIRKIYMQICSLYVYVPYCYVSAKNSAKTAMLKQLEADSWVSFLEDPIQGLSLKKDFSYLLQIDKSAEELIL